MERTTDEIRALLERWYEARTTRTEECALREWFRTAEELPADLQSARRMFCGFAELAAETVPLRGQDAASSRRQDAGPGRVGGRRWVLARQIAVWSAAAVVAVGVFFAVEYARRPYAYINGKPVRDAEVAMQTVVYLEQLGEFDRSVRGLDEMMNTTQK